MAAKPKLLVITPDFPPARGGIQLLVHRLASTISRLDPLVVAPAIPGAANFDRSSGVAVKRVRTPPGVGHRGRMANLNAGAVAAGLSFKPDIVLSAHIVVSPAASLLRQRLSIPMAQYLLAKEAATRPKLAAFAAARSDATLAISRHTADLARHVGVDERRLHLIPPGVDLPDRTPRPRREQPTIVTVARLEDRYKGHDTIIHALPLIRARVPGVQWVVIGAGSLSGPLQRLADTYGVADSVRFLGSVSDVERDTWLEQAHVFAMPSRVPGDGLGGEGFGIVYLEANWHELPVVAGNAGGAVDAVLDGETGILIDADDAVALANVIADLLLDPSRRAVLGHGGAEWACQFSWPLITSRVEDVLLSLLGERSGAAVRLV